MKKNYFAILLGVLLILVVGTLYFVFGQGDYRAPLSKFTSNAQRLDAVPMALNNFANPSPVDANQRDFLVGNPKLLEELKEKIRAKAQDDSSSIKTSIAWDVIWMPVVTAIQSDLDFNGDQYKDFLVLEQFTVFVEPDPARPQRTIAFLMKVMGDEKSEKAQMPSLEQTKQAQVLAVADRLGLSNPFSGIKVIKGDSGVQVLWSEYDEASDSFIDGQFALGESENLQIRFEADKEVFEKSADIVGYLYWGAGIFDAMEMAENDIGLEAWSAYSAQTPAFLKKLAAPLFYLNNRAGQIEKNQQLKDFYLGRDHDFLVLVQALFADASQSLLLSELDKKQVQDYAQKNDKAMQDALSAFRWKDKKITRAEFYSTLAEEPDAKEREQLLKSYSATVLEAHKKAMFQTIEPLNKIAEKYGYPYFTALTTTELYDISPKQYQEVVDRYYESNKETLDQFVSELTSLNGGQTPYEWDVQFLSAALVKKKLNGKDIPKVSYDQAIHTVKNFYHDIGFDLDPLLERGDIFLDTNKRDNKKGNAAATMFEDGSKAWFTANFDQSEKIVLEDMATVLHEFAHDLHFIYSAKKARGNAVFGFVGNPNMWTEGIATALDGHVLLRPFLDRYLKELPDFSDPELRRVIGEVNEKLAVYEKLMLMCRALWDINLYRTVDENGNAISLEERLNHWPFLVKKYLHVKAIPGTEGGRVYATPHFPATPGYYVSYTGGHTTAMHAVENITKGLENQNAKQLRYGGQVLRHLFEMGARLQTVEQIDAAIDDFVTKNPL